VFSSTARSPARMDGPSMTYGTCSAGWGVMCSMSRGRTWPTARCGGGRDGALVVPARGQRTWRDKARMSTGRGWGCYSRTQFGRRQSGGWCSTVGWTSGSYRWRWRQMFCGLGRRRVVKEGRDRFKGMMWYYWCPWSGSRGSATVGRRRGRAAAEEGACRCCGPAVLVEETWIGLLSELQWVTAVLFVFQIGGGERWWGLPTVSRSRGRCPVKCGGRSRRN
jgi:hypothetical protein